MDIANVNKPVPPPVSQASSPSAAVKSKEPAAARGSTLPPEGQQDVPGGAQSLVKSPDAGEVRALVDQTNTALQARFSDLKFTLAEGTDIPVVRIEDKETGELIRQIPSEAMVAIAQALEESTHGTVFEEEV